MRTSEKQPDFNSTASTIIILHQVEKTWRCMAASVNEESNPTIEDTCEVGENELPKFLNDHSSSRVYSILPGSDTVCRTTILPDVEKAQINEALRLQVEAKLLGGTPPHRRAHAPLDAAVAETNRVGLIVTWPESSEARYPTCLNDACFIPDAVAIAALLDGFRPTDPLLFADPSNGTVTIALSHANGAALRATRETSTSKESFSEGILRTASETASLHNHSAPFTEAMHVRLQSALMAIPENENILLLPEEIIEGATKRLDHCEDTDSWWSTWGIAVGGLLAATGTLQSLTTMQQDAIELHPSAMEQLAKKLESRKIATRLLITAVLALALGPALISGIRLGVLSVLNPDIEGRYNESVLERKQHIVYKELAKSVWPMTKLISDITNNVPIGIDVESLQIDIGEPVSIRGRAIPADGKSAAELIALLQEKLQTTGIYKDIAFSYNPSGTFGDREFDLWATVSDSLRRPHYIPEKDFGKWTLAMRQSGTPIHEIEVDEHFLTEPLEVQEDIGASPLASANADEIQGNIETPAHIGDHEDRERSTRTRPTGRDSGAKSHSDARDAGGSKARVPDPLSPELIKTMSRDETNIALKDVTEGLKRIGRTDPDTKKRLRAEMRLLLDRLKEVPE